MNVKELMLEDYVWSVANVAPFQVDIYCLKDFVENDEIFRQDIEPISLTKEILEKNGWKREFDKKEYMTLYHFENDEKVWLMWCIEEHNLDIQRQNKELLERNWSAARVCIPCDYVHTLQHALRLIGYDKEVII